MSLPPGQQRTLDGIEHALQASEPHLAAKFAMFTRLGSPDGPIGLERIRASGFRFRAVFSMATLIPVAIALLIAGIVLGGIAHGAAKCYSVRYIPPGRGFAGCRLDMRPVRSVRPAPRSPQPNRERRNAPDHG